MCVCIYVLYIYIYRGCALLQQVHSKVELFGCLQEETREREGMEEKLIVSVCVVCGWCVCACVCAY